MARKRKHDVKKDGESDDVTCVAIVWSELLVAIALGISVVVYQRLKLLGVPNEFLELMKYVNSTRRAPPTRKLKLSEMFCGVAAITRSFQNAVTTGGPGLKSTQAYTDEFGEAVGKNSKKHKEMSQGREQNMSLERLWENKQKETKGNIAGEGTQTMSLERLSCKRI